MLNFDIYVNGRKLQARRGDTILITLNRNGINVPTLCSYKDLSPTGNCRLCVVEVENTPNLVTSCSHFVEPNMKIWTHTQRVIKARRTLVELLLGGHPDDCLYCIRNGCCELQSLAKDLDIRERRITSNKIKQKIDLTNQSIVRDPSKCILCGRCVRICDEIQRVSVFEFINRGSNSRVATSMDQVLNQSNCIGCGQCVIACPTAALSEKTAISVILDALSDPTLLVTIQLDPALTFSIAQEFGLKPGKDIGGLLVSALKRVGFNYIFDTSFASDLLSEETANVILKGIESNVNQTLITSNCPSWVRYVEQFYPELIPLLSPLKSSQQMVGTLAKIYLSGKENINPNTIFSVAASPCLARKFESQRGETKSKGLLDVDAVISSREVIQLIKLFGIDLHSLESKPFDSPFSNSSSDAKLFATSGGFTESVIRNLIAKNNGFSNLSTVISEFRTTPTGCKTIEAQVNNSKLKFTLSNGLTEICKVIEAARSNPPSFHLVEVMACPGGCINGGGQPYENSEKLFKAKLKSLYDQVEPDLKKDAKQKNSFSQVIEMIQKFSTTPLNTTQLNTNFSKRDVMI